MIICVNVSQTKIISVINFVGWFLVFNTTFNNISVISWRSVLLVEETGVTEYTSPWTGFELTTLVVIGTDCTDSCKSNYHMVTITTAPT